MPGRDIAVTGTLQGLYGLLLVLQEAPDTLADLLERLVADHAESPLVADIARVFGAGEDVGASEVLHEVLAHPGWTEFVPKRKFASFSESLEAKGETQRLVVEAVAQRLVSEGLLDADESADAIAEIDPTG